MANDYSKKIDQLRAQLQQIEARQREDRRKMENRQKIVIGATVIKAMENDPAFRDQVVSILNEKVTRPNDREAVQPWLPII